MDAIVAFSMNEAKKVQKSLRLYEENPLFTLKIRQISLIPVDFLYFSHPRAALFPPPLTEIIKLKFFANAQP